ncbi:MAG: LacI family DNA-binding transcriptional regulator [Silicimonas sp.]|jgi:LacI family transcriptional regulator|nr:LacI family DNA-binding transcriptional regulator [Silicimonas sp.]
MPRTPTLEDVATRAGVSTATVSRCLNMPEKVVEATRQRVMEAVEALGYAPNFSARALVAKRTLTIGAVIPTMENAIFAEGIQAFQDILQAAGYTLLIASSGYDPATEAEAIRTLVARGADGLLLIGFDRDPALYSFLDKQGIPAVVAWAYDAAGPLVSVGFDSRAAMHHLACHAIGLGHRHIGMISARQSGNDRARARVEGVTEAMRDAGLGAPVLEETDYGIEEGAAAFSRLLDRDPALTLVMCGNDVLAAGATRQAEQHGLSVPRDISLTGFDDLELARLVTPALTTVRVPHRAMGEAAARTILAALAGETPSARLLPTDIKLRESLGPPRA